MLGQGLRADEDGEAIVERIHSKSMLRPVTQQYSLGVLQGLQASMMGVTLSPHIEHLNVASDLLVAEHGISNSKG